MSRREIRGRLAVLAAILVQLAACGGGGGNSGPPPVTASFAVTPTTAALTATSVNSPAPIGTFIRGTVTGTVTGTLYINILISGPAVKSVGTLTVAPGSNFGTALIVPQDPWGLGVGTFASTLTVHACQGDQTCQTGELAGSPQVVNVTYTIPPTPIAPISISLVNPPEVASGSSGDVVLRSTGWGAIAAPTSLLVGGTAAVAFTHPDPTTFTVTYPALAAGSYPVTTNNNDQLGTVTVVDVPAFSAASLSYPASPGGIADVLYDLDAQALIVTTQNSDSSTNQLLSYGYSNGAWSTAVPTGMGGLRHAVPLVYSPGPGLLLVSETSLGYYQSAGTSIQNMFGAEIFTGAAFSNAGYYLLTLETPGTSGAQTATFTPGGVPFGMTFPTPASAGAFPQPTIAGSADGSRVVIVGASGAATRIAAFDSTHELLSDTAVVFNHNATGRIPALDRRATRIVVSNDTATNVYDGGFNLLGTLPATIQAYVVNSAGTRVYTYDATPQILSFDVSSSAAGGAYAPLGTPLAVAAAGAAPRMSISLDDKTLFVAGTTQVIVQPVP